MTLNGQTTIFTRKYSPWRQGVPFWGAGPWVHGSRGRSNIMRPLGPTQYASAANCAYISKNEETTYKPTTAWNKESAYYANTVSQFATRWVARLGDEVL